MRKKIIKVFVPTHRRNGKVIEPYIYFKKVKKYRPITKKKALSEFKKRNKASQKVDRRKTSKKITVTEKYLRRPDIYDYPGVDTKNAGGTAKERQIEDYIIIAKWLYQHVHDVECKEVPTYILKFAKKYHFLYSGKVYKGFVNRSRQKYKKGDVINLKPVYSSWSKKQKGAKLFFLTRNDILLESYTNRGIDILKAYRKVSSLLKKEKKYRKLINQNIATMESEVVAKIQKAKVIDVK